MLRNGTDPHELLHLWSSQEESDTKLIVHSHEILKESSSKVSIHFSSGDTNVFLVNLTHLYEYGKRIYIMDSHGQYKKNIRLSSIIFEDEIIISFIRFHALTGNNYISSFNRKGKAACFKILQSSSKFQSTLVTLVNDLNISDDLLTKLEDVKFGLWKITANIRIKPKLLIFQLFYLADLYCISRGQSFLQVSGKDVSK